MSKSIIVNGTALEGQAQLNQRPISEWPIDWVFKTEEDFKKRSQLGGVCYLAAQSGVKIL